MIDTTSPAHMRGYFTPVTDEIDATELTVTGTLPPELDGRYLRNGPNPKLDEPSGHLFTGHGMLHGVRLRDGKAEWYRNRWVRTRMLAGESPFRSDGSFDRGFGAANTSIVQHNGKLFALVESSFPYEVTPELDTIGPCDFDGRLTTAMTAHPKEDPVTGELHFFGYDVRAPYLTYHHLSATGELVFSCPIEVPGPTMMHDMAITEHHVIWLDLPVTLQAELGDRQMPFGWSDSYGARIGVMAKGGGPVRWFEVEPSYVFHVGNAFEDSVGRIVLDAVRYDRSAWNSVWGATGGAGIATARAQQLYRWTLDPATGRTHEGPLDDRSVEFPTVNDQHVGLANRYLYAVDRSTIVKYDVSTGSSEVHDLGEGWRAGEAVFVPATNACAEDDGWLMSLNTHENPDVPSELRILDATAVNAAPVAAVHLPRRVPAGFHGNWIPETELA